MNWHPYANLFPMLEENELQKLADDIAENGQHQPVIVDDRGLILDGRNRSAACALAGIKPATREFFGTDAEKLAFVLSANLHRRHLDTAQRAMVADNLASLKKGQKKSDTGIPVSQPSQSEAASMLNVSVDSVQKARTVRKKAAPEVVAAVERGELSLNAAVETVKPTTSTKNNFKPPVVDDILRYVSTVGKDKQLHGELVKIITKGLRLLTADERVDVVAKSLRALTPEQRAKALEGFTDTTSQQPTV